MSYKSNTDNIYKEGTIIRAKRKPDVELIIMRYFHRTYYCAPVENRSQAHLAYFERELIPPNKSKMWYS
jgi:hypothetical protein